MVSTIVLLGFLCLFLLGFSRYLFILLTMASAASSSGCANMTLGENEDIINVFIPKEEPLALPEVHPWTVGGRFFTESPINFESMRQTLASIY